MSPNPNAGTLQLGQVSKPAMSRRLLWALLLIAVAGCASRRPSPQLMAELGQAHSLLAAGCYRCLEEALSTFERLAGQPNAPPEVGRYAFYATLLLVVRARELGLPDSVVMDLARLRNRDLPAGPPGLLPGTYFDALRLVSGELTGYSPEERERRGKERRSLWTTDGTVPAARAALSDGVETDLVAQYIALAIDCEDAQARKTLDTGPILARYPVPLMRFRVALCARTTDALSQQMAALRDADPRWVDTFFFEGAREMSRYPAPDVGRAAELFALAHDAFPESPAVTLALANAQNALSEYDRALALFDQVLAGHPTHRDALLGRVLSLSYLNRYQDAIRSATQLLGLGMYHQGDAYYWRAWNRYRVHQLPAAWEDVTAATKLMVNTSVYTLAGFIAYAQQRLDVAIDRLTEAYRLDATNCEAVWTEALVHVDKEAWTPASGRFAVAMKCFTGAAEQARRDIAVAQEAEWAEPLKTRRLAAAQKQLETAQHRGAQAAFNAAGSYARLGQKADAIVYIELAARHPLLKEKAASLRASIEKLP
jgi:tetratricopeptide (TPR) repeat protein